MFTSSHSQQIYHKNKYDTRIAKDKIWFQKEDQKKKKQKLFSKKKKRLQKTKKETLEHEVRYHRTRGPQIVYFYYLLYTTQLTIPHLYLSNHQPHTYPTTNHT